MTPATAPAPTLTPDILLEIFKLVYTAIRPVKYVPKYTSPHLSCTIPGCIGTLPYDDTICACGYTLYEAPGWDETDNMFSPALFPYSLAAVCTGWRAAMLLSPEFWTRIVVILDSFTPSSSRALREDLECSRTELIDVLIMRRQESICDMAKHVELARVQQILDILHPHLGRCKSLGIYVNHTSSLPTISPAFLASMTYSTSVLLHAQTDSGPGQAQSSIYPHVSDGPSKWPVLQALLLDGWNFAQLCRFPPDQVKEVLISCRVLIVETGGGDLPLRKVMKLLKALPNLIKLVLSKVTFIGTRGPEQLDVSDLELLFLPAKLTAAVLTSCIPSIKLRIVGCPLGTTKNPLPPSLVLEEIKESHDIEHILEMWNGTYLRVYSCPGFDDRILALLSERFEWGIRRPRPDPIRLTCRLNTLEIEDCHNLSVHAVERIASAYEFHSGEQIWLDMDNCISLSEEEINWIMGRTRRFTYAPMRIDDRNEPIADSEGMPPRRPKKIVPKYVQAILRGSSWFICSTN